jgi:hypothetical protein
VSKIQGTVTIDAQEYLTLLQRAADLSALEGAGVDNWDGYCEVEPRTEREEAAILSMVKEKLNA